MATTTDAGTSGTFRERLQAQASEQLTVLDKHLEVSDDPVARTVQQLAGMTGFKRRNLFLGIAASVVLVILTAHGMQLLCTIVGFIYPSYQSFKAIESRDKNDDTRWLTYWVVFAFFSVLEQFTDTVISWIPFYFVIKLVFIIWCMAPGPSNGSVFMYDRVLRPYLLKHEKRIDGVAQRASKFAGGMVRDAVSDAVSDAMTHGATSAVKSKDL